MRRSIARPLCNIWASYRVEGRRESHALYYNIISTWSKIKLKLNKCRIVEHDFNALLPPVRRRWSPLSSPSARHNPKLQDRGYGLVYHVMCLCTLPPFAGYLFRLPTEGWFRLSRREVPGFAPRWSTRPKTATHPGINRAWRRIPTLIESNALPLSQTGNQDYSIKIKGPFIATQLNSTRRRVELSSVAIDTLTDATQLSPTIGNATDQVAAYGQSTRSRSVELSCIGVAIDTSPTQLNSTWRRVKLSCDAINGP